eukprot:jgi/Galph1/5547/GphlegSOOS_G4106.1
MLPGFVGELLGSVQVHYRPNSSFTRQSFSCRRCFFSRASFLLIPRLLVSKRSWYNVSTATASVPGKDEEPQEKATEEQKQEIYSEFEEETATSTPSQTEESSEQQPDDLLNSPSFLKKKLELLEKELQAAKEAVEQAEKQMTEKKEAYVRLAADFENYRKRMNKEKQDLVEVTKANVIKELVAVLDNFERAAGAIKTSTENEKKIHDAYQALAKQLLDAMLKLNVEPIDAVGQPFDPNLHEAVNQIDSQDHEEGVVAMQYQRGYKIGERLVRPALCVVSTGPGPSKKEKGEQATQQDATEN